MTDDIQDRRTAVLESALDTFGRFGYRATSMDDVARRARISRPGLYLYFSSKPALLRSAVEHALARDVARSEVLLADPAMPLRERIQRALDLWSGQYVGPLAADLDGLMQRDAALLGDIPLHYSTRFGTALADALQTASGSDSTPPTVGSPSVESMRELIMTVAVGLKYRAADREDFSMRLRDALRIILG